MLPCVLHGYFAWLYAQILTRIIPPGGVGHSSHDFIHPITRRAFDTNGGRRSFGLYVKHHSFLVNFFCCQVMRRFIFGNLLEDDLAKLWFKRQVQVNVFVIKTWQWKRKSLRELCLSRVFDMGIHLAPLSWIIFAQKCSLIVKLYEKASHAGWPPLLDGENFAWSRRFFRVFFFTYSFDFLGVTGTTSFDLLFFCFPDKFYSTWTSWRPFFDFYFSWQKNMAESDNNGESRQSVCLAGGGLPYVDATVADNGSAADRQGSSKDCCWERRKTNLWLECAVIIYLKAS